MYHQFRGMCSGCSTHKNGSCRKNNKHNDFAVTLIKLSVLVCAELNGAGSVIILNEAKLTAKCGTLFEANNRYWWYSIFNLSGYRDCFKFEKENISW